MRTKSFLCVLGKLSPCALLQPHRHCVKTVISSARVTVCVCVCDARKRQNVPSAVAGQTQGRQT